MVYEGQDKKLRKSVAVKVYEKKKINSDEKKKMIQTEIDMHRLMVHPQIVKLLKVVEDSKHLFLIQELGSKDSLNDKINNSIDKKLSETISRGIFKQIVHAVKYFHDKDICHRDLKISNILINHNNKVKIIDFGFAAHNQSDFKTYCGTPSYMPPEMVKKINYDGIKTDIWTLGVVLYKMVTGEYPFGGEKDKDLDYRILNGNLRTPRHVSESCRNMISYCQNIKQEDRPDIYQIENHAWLEYV